MPWFRLKIFLYVVLGAVLLWAVVCVWRGTPDEEPKELTQKQVATTSSPRTCPAEYLKEIWETSVLSEAESLGAAYFGGSREYNLSCARAAYSRAIDIDAKGSFLLWHQLGRIDFLEGKFDDAIFKFEKQIEYFGDTLPNVHYMLGLTYGYKARRGGTEADWEEAEQSFKRYIELDPMSPWARVDLAWVFFAQGKYQEMKPYLEVGMLSYPRNPWLLNMYGLALLNTGDREGAYLYFTAARVYAEKLTIEEWGAAYPGNDPNIWEQGLKEMRVAIEKNHALVAGEFEE